MKEFELTLKLRNNLLKQKRLEHGFLTQSQAAEAIGLSPNTYCKFENLRLSPRSSTNDWRESALKVAQYYGCSPDELWPNVVLSVTEPELVKQIGADELAALASMAASAELPPKPDELLMEARDTEGVRECLAGLKTRTRKIVELRIGFGCQPETFEAIGDRFGISGTRTKQVFLEGLKELREKLGLWHVKKYEWTCECGVTHPSHVVVCKKCHSQSPWRGSRYCLGLETVEKPWW